MKTVEWIDAEKKPDQHGYYLAAWDDEGHWRVSELWFNPQSTGSGWWPTRGYMVRFVGDVASTSPKRSLTVAGWMPIPEFPGEGKIIAYMHDDMVLDPKDVKIIRQGVTLGGP
jgi:hypothetical protein